MKKRLILIIILLLCFLPIVFASSIDSEIQRVTHYAEEYETGNINYAQLSVYLSEIRQNLNEIAGASDKENGGVVEQNQLRSLLGEPQEETKWVWVENEQQDKRLDEYIPVWNKIVFDGKKIQILLSAYPSMYNVISPELKKEIWDLEEQGKYEEAQELKETKGEEKLVYRLNFEKTFKQEEEFDVDASIKEIKELAEIFQADSSNSNAEALAEESVNVEKAFEQLYKQSAGKCEDIMVSIFGSQNLRGTTGIIAYEMTVYEEENLEAILKLEMCDDCDFNWINMYLWVDGRGNFKIEKTEESNNFESKEKYQAMTDSEFKEEIANLFNDMVASLKQRDFSKALSDSQKLNTLNQYWNENSNNVWKEVEDSTKNIEDSMTEQERKEYYENYGWIKREQEKQAKVQELAKSNFENRKQFYFSLVESYEKRESYVKQTEYEMRLIEEKRTVSEERCDNNIDDNNDGAIDCSDSICAGQFCGTVSSLSTVENQTVEEKIELYCIASKCQQKTEEEIVNQSICGNNICEYGEDVNCKQDCANCSVWEAIPCAGKLIFSGIDEIGCELEPICVETNLSCAAATDCDSPLCGKVDCIEGACQVIKLEECREAECVDGDEKVISCGEKKLVKEICIESMWKETGVACETKIENSNETEVESERQIIGSGCVTKEDCGGVNDVCSNGLCVTLPEVKEEIVEEETASETGTSTEEENVINEASSTESKNIVNEESENKNEDTSIEEETEANKESEEEKAEVNEEPEEETNEKENIAEGGIINIFLGIIGRITGFVGEEENTDTGSGSNSETISNEINSNSDSSSGNSKTEGGRVVVNSESGGSSDSGQEFIYNEVKGEGENNNAEYNNNMENNYNEEEENNQEEREEEEKERKQKDCNDRCERECYDRLIRPCTEECIWKGCGKDLIDCDIDSATKKCEASCKENETDSCEEECYGKCMKNENTWVQSETKTWEEEVGVFTLGGGCKQEQGQTNAYIWFGGWGTPFEELQPLKQKYYQGGQSDWCERELEDSKLQRQEFENSFNQEFAIWFFEEHLANSANNWEQASSGIFELYYDGSTRISEEMARSMTCLGLTDIPFEYNLINLSYETEYGKIEYWEEVERTSSEKFGGEEDVEIISPYMKVWIFPSKEFMKYELKKSMTEHDFPGSSEGENDNGPSEEEKIMIKQNEGFMKKLEEIVSNYNGNLEGVVQVKDEVSEEILFNLYVQVNEEDIISMEPMLPEEVESKDVTITINFEDLYDLIYTSEKEMQKDYVESPHWSNKKVGPGKIKEISNGIKMASKVRKIINNAEISPETADKDIKKLIDLVLKMMMQEGDKSTDSKEQSASSNAGKEGNTTSKEITSMNGKVVRGF